MEEVASPCIDKCGLDPTGRWCLGCGRTGDEIAGWMTADDEERLEILDRLSERLARLSPKSGA